MTGKKTVQFTVFLDSRHGLVDGLNPIAHGKLIHYFLSHIIKVDFPRIVSTSLWNFYHTLTKYIS